MSRRNQKDDVTATVATVALGAAVGYGCYKLFETLFSSNEPHSSSSSNPGKVPRPIQFRSSLPRSSPRDSKIYVIDSIEEFRYAMRELKSYVNQILVALVSSEFLLNHLFSHFPNRHCKEYNVFGFDCEWVVDQYGVRQNVALIQLASHRGLCVLVRLCEFGKIPSELQVNLEGEIHIDTKMFINFLITFDFVSNCHRKYYKIEIF